MSNLTLEFPGGGGIELRSIGSAILENIFSVDMLSHTPSAPTILIGKSSADDSLPSRSITLIGCNLTEGTISMPDLKVESAPAQQGPLIIGGRVNFIESGSPATLVHCMYNHATPPPLRLANNNTISADHIVASRFSGGCLNTVTGISGLETVSKNLRGNFRVEGDSNRAEVLFEEDKQETSPHYHVTATPTYQSSNTATGSNRILSIGKGVSGFVVYTEEAPGEGEYVEFDWHLIM